MTTIVQQLSDFTVDTIFDALPSDVVHECKRIVLDSLGCSLAGTGHQKARIGREFAQTLGSSTAATIFGSAERASIMGAAFANAESMNTIDFDLVLFPGHVTPYVLPGALAVGEQVGCSGKDLILVVAISHEISNRFGKAVDNLRDVKDGKLDVPPVFGYANTIFGATAAVAKLKKLSRETLSNALGIAAAISPVNSQMAWNHCAPAATIKYMLAGLIPQSALTAVYLAEFGHHGDTGVLDDPEVGYRRFIGSRKWEPEWITRGLGVEWGFQDQLAYKPYPSCRILHTVLGALTALLEEHDIRHEEIEGIKVWVEGFVDLPVWQNRDIRDVVDGQFSVAHAVALAAHRVPAGKAWQDPELVFRRSVLDLMGRVTFEVHPDYVKLLSGHGASRPGRVEVKARGQTFVREQRFPKGSKSAEPDSYMTDAELIAKFRDNASGILPLRIIDQTVDGVMGLESVENVANVLRPLGGSSGSSQVGGGRADAA